MNILYLLLFKHCPMDVTVEHKNNERFNTDLIEDYPKKEPLSLLESLGYTFWIIFKINKGGTCPVLLCSPLGTRLALAIKSLLMDDGLILKAIRYRIVIVERLSHGNLN